VVGPLQLAVASKIAGARVQVKQLQTNPVEQPVEVMVTSQSDIGEDGERADNETLRALARQVKQVLYEVPKAMNVHDDWGEESVAVRLDVDPDRANLAGISHADVAAS